MVATVSAVSAVSAAAAAAANLGMGKEQAFLILVSDPSWSSGVKAWMLGYFKDKVISYTVRNIKVRSHCTESNVTKS